MCIPREKIYNDAPDEFAKSLDQGGPAVSLRELGGTDNPFIKVGIYKLEDDEFVSYHTHCPYCEAWTGTDDQPDEYGFINFSCGCGTQFQHEVDECTYYTIDHAALAEFISKGLKCTVCRQFQGGWLFGKLRNYDVYFACAPTKGMYKALESTPKSILIIGKNTPELLPTPLATRVIYLSRLLYVMDGELHFASEVIDEKIPLSHEGERTKGAKKGAPKKAQSRPPIQAYTPLYLKMIREWIYNLHAKNETGTPSIDYINDWMRKNGRIDGVAPVSKWQTRRHINKLTGKAKGENIDPTFSVYWNGCTSESFISENHSKDISKTIMTLFSVANRTGFKVSLMHGMDAAEYATKVKTAKL